MNKRAKGKEKELLACSYLKDKGYLILVENYYCRYGEVDLIAKEKNDLVFVEIKYRNSAVCGDAIEAVDLRKQKKIAKCALNYLRENQIVEYNLRFDVIGIQDNKISHYQDAFCFFM